MWKRSRHLSARADASCSSAAAGRLSSATGRMKYAVGPAVPCLLMVIMWCDFKRKTFVSFHKALWVSTSMTTQFNIIYVIIKQLLETIFGFQLSHSARFLSTLTPQQATPPPAMWWPFSLIEFEEATTNEEGLGKYNILPFKIAQSGSNARPTESSPLCGVGGVSGLGPG